MKEKKPTALTFDAESLAAVALRVKAAGFLPAAVLREEFGPERTTQAIALLFRDFRIFREARRPWTDGHEALGYEWADRRFSRSEAKKVPPDLGFLIELCAKPAKVYGDFRTVMVRCRWTAPILGSVPKKDSHEDPLNTFERDHEGNLLILRYHQRAMAQVALPMIGKEAAAARRIGFAKIRIPSTTPVKEVQHGIVEVNRPGGKGLRRSECIADGLEFTIRAHVPTSVLSIEEFLRMLQHAGEFVGLSPGRSSGFGDFEVLRAD